MKILPTLAAVAALTAPLVAQEKLTVVYEGKDGPGKGKHIVLLAGDEEYRSEEALPQLGKILSQRHGFKSTVVFSIDPKTGEIDPKTTTNQPGIEALDSADLCIMLLRFRDWPAKQMQHFVKYFESGKPMIALRTSTHAFNITDPKSPLAKYHWQSKTDWIGGFGQQVLGETWVAHHGNHKVEATRGIIEPAAKENPVLRGVDDIFGTTDVYTVKNLPADAKVLVRGQVLVGMKPTDAALEGEKNNPMMPIVWTREYRHDSGKTNRILTTTMGAATDLENEGLRRLVVNGAYWGLGMEAQIPAKADVSIVGEYKPSFYGFEGFIKGVNPAAHGLNP